MTENSAATEAIPETEAQGGGSPGRRSVRVFHVALVLLVVVALGSVALVLSVSTVTRGRLDADVDSDPALVEVVTQTTDSAFTATVVLSSLESRSITVRSGGVVTKLDLQAGEQSPPEGTAALWVDDRPVVAQYGAAPIAQDVGAGSPAPAVERVQSFLTRLGYYDGPRDGKWGAATSSATRRFLTDRERGFDGAFRSEAVVWLGTEPARLHDMQLRVGDDVAPGQVIGQVGILAADVSVRPPGGQELDDESGWVIEVKDQVVPLATDFTVPANERAGLASVLEVDVDTPGVVRRVTSTDITLIPGTAIVTDGGQTCVISSDGEPVDVQIGGSGLEGVEVRFSGATPDRIRLTPPVGRDCR